MKGYAGYEYIPFDGERFFTVVLLPEKGGRFPTVIFRSPYVGDAVWKGSEPGPALGTVGAKEGLVGEGGCRVCKQPEGRDNPAGRRGLRRGRQAPPEDGTLIFWQNQDHPSAAFRVCQKGKGLRPYPPETDSHISPNAKIPT